MDAFSALKFFGAIFAIMNPFANLPIFLGVTDGASDSERRQIAIKVVLYCLILGGAFALIGDAALKFFGISVDDFRVAGGLVVLLIGLNMLNGDESSSHHGTKGEKAVYPSAATVAFYPMTFPILIGPGTITTLILYRQQADSAADLISYGGVFIAVVALLGAALIFAGQISHYLSQTARVIMTRLMGMILAAIAVDMIASGLKNLLPGLG